MKIRAPKEVQELLTAHWERNKDFKTEEVWPVGNGTWYYRFVAATTHNVILHVVSHLFCSILQYTPTTGQLLPKW
jgi:hypothetical protein